MSIKYKAPKKRGDENKLKEAIKSAPAGVRQAAPVQQDDEETDIYGMAADNSVFGEAAADMPFKDVADTPFKASIPGEIRQQAEDVAADTRAANEDYLRDVYGDGGGDQGDEGAPAPAEEEPQGLFEDVTDIDARQERERQAFADELAARKAEQQQQAEARAGLGGMGLSGATAELTADIGRQAERAGDIAMADLGRRQQQETFDELRRQASIWTFEEEFGVDLDGDGNYGAPPEELPPPPPEDGQADKSIGRRADQSASLTENLLATDETAPRGSKSNPIVVDNIEETPADAKWAKDDQGKNIYDENGRQLLVDSQGRYYAV